MNFRKMETLEETVKRIYALRSGLYKKIIVQKEISHEEERYFPGGPFGPDSYREPCEYKETVIDRPEISNPDTETREASRQGLQQSYDSCPWYSGRYIAAGGLNVSPERLNSDMNLWLRGLEEKLMATKIVEKNIIVGSHEDSETINYRLPSCDSHGGPGSETRRVQVDDYETREFEIADGDNRFAAIEDLCYLSKFFHSSIFNDALGKIYSGNFNKSLENAPEDIDDYGMPRKIGINRQIRKKAGEVLGYSPNQIWMRLHSSEIGCLASLIGGIAATATASGIGYMAYQYFIK